MYSHISTTVRLHVAYVGSDYYPLSWNPLRILGSEQDILLEDSKDPQNRGRCIPPARPFPPGGLLDASKRLKTPLRRLQMALKWPKRPPRRLQMAPRRPKRPSRGLQEPPRSIFPLNMGPLNLKEPSKSIGKILVLSLYTNLA